jgi:type I restriction enzyme M protein
MAGFVLANGSMSSNTSNEGEIRKNIIEADLVECMVALPSQLFYNTMIPACLWFVSRDKKNHRFKELRAQVLFIDARKLGTMVDRRHKELRAEDIGKIAETYHAWRGELTKEYRDIPGFCKSSSIEEIRRQAWILTPGRYVGAEAERVESEGFEDAMKRLTSDLAHQMGEGRVLDDEIKRNLRSIGYGV